MPDFDATLKIFLRRLAAPVFEQLTGVPIAEWLQPELPEIRTLRPDLVGRTPAGEIVHFEIQAQNDPAMPMRQMEYALGIWKALKQWPQQIVLYVGPEPMRMAEEFRGYRYRIIDVSLIDAEPLLASERLEDNVIAVLFRLTDQRAALRRILDCIAQADPGRRAEAAKGLFVLAGLRKLRPMLQEEEKRAKTMLDLTYDWVSDPTFGPIIARATAEAVAKATAEVVAKATADAVVKATAEARVAALAEIQAEAQAAEQRIFRRLVEKRFGALSETTAARIALMSLSEIEELSLRLLDAASLDELFS
jgi:hypothetical protein